MNADLQYLDALEHISRIALRSVSVEEMLYNTLGEMLAVFNCDRAWFVYPCDPSAHWWRVRMERDRPQWPGAEINVEHPVNRFVAALFSRALDAPGPLSYNIVDHPDFRDSEETIHYHIQSQIVLAIRPKIGKPWLLGIHYCEEPHIFSDE